MASSARLDELKKKFDDNPRRYFAPLANEYRKLGDLIQAIALCRTHLPNQPGHISGNIVLAQALYESRDLGESRQAFEAALDLDPENLIALRFLGDIAREEGSPAVAHSWYQRVLEADPRNDEISQLIREVQTEEAAARHELASRPTPPTVQAIATEESEPIADAVAFTENEDEFTVEVPESFAGSAEAASSVEAPVEGPAGESTEVAPEPLELPSFDAEFAPPAPAAPAFAALDADDPFFSQDSMGEFEAAAEPSIDDWFSAESVAEAPTAAAAAAPEAESLFPDLSSASDLPSPALAESVLAEPTGKFSWNSAPPEEPVAEVAAEASAEYVADPESDTIEFTIEAATPFPEPVEELAPVLEAPEAPVAEETFEPAPWATADAIEPAPEAIEQVEAPTYDWSADDGPSEPATAWTEASTTEMPSAWESALDPEQLTPVSEAPVEREQPNPLIGRTPRFEHAIPEEPPAPFVTETMAELYLQQGFNEEGLAIYRQLLRQSPHDESLQRRIASLENSGESNVLDAASSEAPSVRAFFARFATRARRRLDDRTPNDAEGGHTAFGGVASADEAMTQPDEPSSLTQVFAARAVSTSDAQAAATLASAFGIESTSDAASGEGELSLGHLFRDVEAHSPGAVTSAGFADAATEGPDTRQASDVESHADIEQFTAWLEGLKKK